MLPGYDEEGTLYGLDGSQGYWGASPAEPSGYEGELFVLPDWSDKLAHAFVLGKRKEPGLTVDDITGRRDPDNDGCGKSLL